MKTVANYLLLAVIYSFAITLIVKASTLNQNRFYLDYLLNMKEVGQAKYSRFFFDIYTSRLLTPTGEFSVNQQEFIFEIRYLINIDAEDLLEATQQQWQKQGVSADISNQYLEQLSTLWPNIKSGDKLSLLVMPSFSQFYFNDDLLGTISDEQFGTVFSNIWLAENTTEPSLRKQLIGAKS